VSIDEKKGGSADAKGPFFSLTGLLDEARPVAVTSANSVPKNQAGRLRDRPVMIAEQSAN
jgi:hypothetical protein